MYSHILVPVDLSDARPHTLAAAVDLARHHHAAITLLHVIESIDGVDRGELEDFYTELTTAAEHHLADCKKKLSEQGVDVKSAVLRGKRVREIIQYAESEGHEVIVIGTHRTDGHDGPNALGTISHQVALLAHCTVMLVR